MHGAKGIEWADLEVRNTMDGVPSVTLRGVAADVCKSKGIDEIKISFSHCRLFATVFAVALGEPSA